MANEGVTTRAQNPMQGHRGLPEGWTIKLEAKGAYAGLGGDVKRGVGGKRGGVLGDASKNMDGSSATIRDVDAGRRDLIPKAGRGPPATRQMDHGAEPPKRSRKVRARITEMPR